MNLFEVAQPARSKLSVLILCLICLVGFTALAYYGQIYISQTLIGALVRSGLIDQQSVLVGFLFLFVGFSPSLIGLALLISMIERRALTYLIMLYGMKLSWVIIALAIGFCLTVIPLMILSLVKPVGISLTDKWVLPGAILPVALGIAGVAFQSFAEEMWFRGWLLPKIAPITGLIGAVALTSIAFAVGHSVNANFNLGRLLELTLVGSIFGMLVVLTKSIWPSVIAHMSWNWFLGHLFGFEGFSDPAYNLIWITELSDNAILENTNLFSIPYIISSGLIALILVWFYLSRKRRAACENS